MNSPNHTIIYSILLLPSMLFGQISINNTCLKNAEENILYINYDNPIEISGLDSTMDISISSHYFLSNITKTGATTFNIRPNYVRNIGTICDTLYVNLNGKRVLAKAYEIKRIGPPIFRMGNLNFKDTVTVEELMENANITFFPPVHQLKQFFVVVEWDMRIINKDNDLMYEFYRPDNGQFSTLQLQLMEQLHAGDRIVFTNIKVKGPDGLRRPINTFSVVIK